MFFLIVGDSKEVISFVIKDDSSSIKCTCWGNMVAQTSCFTIGDILQIEYPDIKVCILKYFKFYINQFII